MESKFLGVTTKLDITLTTGKRSHNALDVAVLSLVGLLCDRVGSLLYSTVCSLCYVFDTVCSMILSTRHTDDINLPYLDHVARRPPLIRHFTTLSSQRDREMRDVYFEKRWASHQEFLWPFDCFGPFVCDIF